MNEERWRRIEALYHAALELPAAERTAFVAAACAGDAPLEADVLSLLEQADASAGFLSTPAITAVARSMPDGQSMIDREIGVYRVQALLGRGGMGEVYRARDQRLRRDVAIKVLPPAFTSSPERLSRFQREARMLAALNHQHIGAIFGVVEADGVRALVLELVEGETLADRLSRGPLPIAEALRIAGQIADAIATAHEKGIIHRDLKPANIKITPAGLVKVLDFGLAKLDTDTAGADVDAFTTVERTLEGVVLGTAAYMSPEQARGRDVDKRTDVWAFGCVLYEMLTGRAAFARETITDTFVAIVEHEPAWDALPPTTPPRIQSLLRHSLEKDPSRRKRDLGDARFEIEEVLAAKVAPAPVPAPISSQAIASPKPNRLRPPIVAAGGALVVMVIAASWWVMRESPAPVRLEVAGITAITNLPGNKVDPAYSPDGSAIAFSWQGQDGNSPGIYVLDRDARAPRRLTQSAFDDVAPAWSPDGREIAFERVKANGVNELIVVSAAGDGPERKLRDVRQSAPLKDASRPLMAWMRDGSAIVIPTLDVDAGGRASLFRIGVHGEPPQRLFGSTGGDGDGYPAISPDGQWLAYALVERQSARLFVRRLGRDGLPQGAAQDVAGGVATIAAPIKSPTWSPDSRRLIFAAGPRVMEWEIGGVSRELWVSTDQVQGLAAQWSGGVLSQIVYAKTVGRTELRELRLDAQGRHAEGPSAEFSSLGWAGLPQFSPDGRWLTFSTQGGAGGLWIATAEGNNPRLLADIWAGTGLHISADSRHVAFHKVDELFAPLYVVDLDANGTATAVRRVAQTSSFALVGASWSADGQYLYTTAVNKTPQRVLRARVSDGELEDLFDGAIPVVAPDGHRVFYKKGLANSPLFVRSLDGDIAANPEEQLVRECVRSSGIVPTSWGVYYVACEGQPPVSLRYFEFATRRSYDVAPPPLGGQPTLTVSADGRRLVYQTTLPNNDELTRVVFRPSSR